MLMNRFLPYQKYNKNIENKQKIKRKWQIKNNEWHLLNDRSIDWLIDWYHWLCNEYVFLTEIIEIERERRLFFSDFYVNVRKKFEMISFSTALVVLKKIY